MVGNASPEDLYHDQALALGRASMPEDGTKLLGKNPHNKLTLPARRVAPLPKTTPASSHGVEGSKASPQGHAARLRAAAPRRGPRPHRLCYRK